MRLILRVGRDVLWSAAQVAAGVWRAKAPAARCFRRRSTRVARRACPRSADDDHGRRAGHGLRAELAPDRSALLIHVFDLDDEAAFIQHYKADYERPLEIFE